MYCIEYIFDSVSGLETVISGNIAYRNDWVQRKKNGLWQECVSPKRVRNWYVASWRERSRWGRWQSSSSVGRTQHCGAREVQHIRQSESTSQFAISGTLSSYEDTLWSVQICRQVRHEQCVQLTGFYPDTTILQFCTIAAYTRMAWRGVFLLLDSSCA